MKDLERRASPDVLQTYLQYTPEEAPARFIDSVTPNGESLTNEEIGLLGQQVHRYVIALLESARHSTRSRDGLELLDDLLQLEAAEGHYLTRASNSAGDI